MKYEKPLIVLSTDAVSVVQGVKKSGNGDNASPYEQTIAAYEADE
jgi:hypothetical protein